jgi:lipopolysaccharide assembly protein A
MLKTLKMVVLALLALVLVVIGVANMTPVDLHLLPGEIGGYDYTLHQVPLVGVILVSVLLGILIGELIEWVREHKHRRTARQKRREAEQLQRENEQLRRRLEDDDLPRIPVR